jgi:hypothetical protein
MVFVSFCVGLHFDFSCLHREVMFWFFLVLLLIFHVCTAMFCFLYFFWSFFCFVFILYRDVVFFIFLSIPVLIFLYHIGT